MRPTRLFWHILVLCLLGKATPAPAQQQIDPRAPSTFAFLHISDIRQNITGSLQPLKSLATATYNMPIRPSFVVATGSATATGRLAEYDRLKQQLAPFTEAKIDFHFLPGSQDTRWVPDGKRMFAQQFGKTYRSFDFEGVHFILMDSTVRLSQWAHLDRTEIEWLGKDLKRVRAETPVFLFFSHPVGRETAQSRPLDNEYDLFPLLKEKNVIAIFTSNEDSDTTWHTHGITTLTLRPIEAGSYHRVIVSPVMVTIERITNENPKPTIVAQIAVKGNRARSRMRAGWNDPDVPYLARRRPAAVLEPRAFEDTTEGELGEYRIDSGAWQPLVRGARDIWTEAFTTKNIPIGMHTATVKITTNNRFVLEDELIFEVERRNNEPSRRWAVDLKESIQSSPVLSQNRLFASCLDGRIYALDRANGKTKWSYKTEGEIVGSPCIEGDTVYVGSTDGNLYAIEAENGRLRWKFDAGTPLVATPIVTKGIVCIGGDGRIFGVNQETGVKAWMCVAQGFFQSRPCTDGVNFYLGGWDNALYAIDALTGNQAWKTTLGLELTGQPAFKNSPSISSPETAQGRIYICTNDGFLHACEANSGKEIWKIRPVGAGDSFSYSSPTVRNGVLYLASLAGTIYALDAVTGKAQWSMPTQQPIYESSVCLAPDGNSLAVIGVRGKVSVLDTRTGKSLWLYELGPGNVLSTPAYDGKIVYTTTMANDVQALNAPGEGITILQDKPQNRN